MIPEPIDAVIIPIVIGIIRRPASVGEAPSTICKISGMVIIPPNIPIPTITPMMVLMLKVEDLNKLSGSNASAPMRRSTKMNETIPIAPVTYIAIDIALDQPHSRPCSATRRIGTTATMMVAAPNQSIFDLRGVCGTCKNETTMNSATTPIGKLIKKIQRQPSTNKNSFMSANNPPISGPSTEEVPNTAMKAPW